MMSAGSVRIAAGSLGSWWLDEWRALTPQFLRAWTTSRRPMRIVLNVDESDVSIAIIKGDNTAVFSKRVSWREYQRAILDLVIEEARLRSDDCDVVLSLAPPHVMTPLIVVPAKARHRAEDIVREHVARKIPLGLGEILLGVDVRPADEGKYEIRALVAPKASLDRLLSRLGLSATEITRIEGPGASPVAIPLAAKAVSHDVLRRSALIVALACIASMIMAWGALAWRQSALIADLELRKIQIDAPAREIAMRLKAARDVTQDVERLGELRRAPGIVQIWEELARILPDHTYLSGLEIRGQNVMISGYSSAAPALIAMIDQSSILTGAGFSGPVVIDRNTGREQFSLQAKLRTTRLPIEEKE